MAQERGESKCEVLRQHMGPSLLLLFGLLVGPFTLSLEARSPPIPPLTRATLVADL